MSYRTMLARLSRPLSARASKALAAVMIGGLAIVVGASLISARVRTGGWGIARLLNPEPEAMNPLTEPSTVILQLPGVRLPPTVPANEAPWNDDDEVVGVTVDGVSRAYALGAMARPARHVVNDVIGAIPVSISYCNFDNCVRAFTGTKGEGPLDLAVGGSFQGQSLLLMIHGERFHQDSLKPYSPEPASQGFPYKDIPFTVTTWKQWKKAHPDTRASIPPVHDPMPGPEMMPRTARQ